jgi:RHS repeat-associated protein
LTGSTVTKYYFAGATRVAMRKYTIPQSMTVEYLLGDHLGSTSITTNANGAKVSEMRYKPWGELRYTWTSAPATTPAYQLPNYTFTGQYSYMDDPSTAAVTEGFGLMFYNARWYDPSLGRFAQADSIVPDPYNSQDWNRYAYTRYNPIRYIDPSGNIPKEEICKYLKICGKNAEDEFIEIYGNELHDLLWDTDITWGDKLAWEEDGELQVAMMVLFTTNGTDFSGVLWGIEGNSVGNPIPFANLANADTRNGHTTVHHSFLYPEIDDAENLPLSFGLPDGAYDGNVPYMQPHDFANWPMGTVTLTILTVFAPATGVPARFVTALGTIDVGSTLIGFSPNPPYWYKQLFGPIQYYPIICMSSMLSRNCSNGGR